MLTGYQPALLIAVAGANNRSPCGSILFLS